MNGTIRPLMTKEDLARYLGVTTSCIDKWMAGRRIPYYRLGRKCVRYDLDKVAAWLARHESSPREGSSRCR